MYEQTRKKLIKILKELRVKYVLFADVSCSEMREIEKEIKQLECSTYEVI